MKTTFIKLAIPLTAASFLAALGLQQANLGHVPWYLSRAAGLVSYALITASVVFGLVLSTKVARRRIPRALAFEVHQFLSILSISFIAIHGGALLFDGFIGFTPTELLLPFASPYLPLWTGLGVIAGWATVAVTGSFWARKQMGYAAWRRFHYLAFGAWGLGLLHGLNAGTDTSAPLVQLLYALSVVAVGGLLAYRMFGARVAMPVRHRARAGVNIIGGLASSTRAR